MKGWILAITYTLVTSLYFWYILRMFFGEYDQILVFNALELRRHKCDMTEINLSLRGVISHITQVFLAAGCYMVYTPTIDPYLKDINISLKPLL